MLNVYVCMCVCVCVCVGGRHYSLPLVWKVKQVAITFLVGIFCMLSVFTITESFSKISKLFESLISELYLSNRVFIRVIFKQ